MSVLTEKVISLCYNKITSFNRWFDTYMNRYNKKKLINLLYEYQQFSKKFLSSYDIGCENRDTVSYEIYLSAVDARKYLDGYYVMNRDQQDEWTLKYNSGTETDGIDLCGNKWVTDAEIREFV